MPTHPDTPTHLSIHAHARAQARARAQRTESDFLTNKRILLVDDNEVIGKLARKLLLSMGMQVTLATDGTTALRCAMFSLLSVPF